MALDDSVCRVARVGDDSDPGCGDRGGTTDELDVVQHPPTHRLWGVGSSEAFIPLGSRDRRHPVCGRADLREQGDRATPRSSRIEQRHTARPLLEVRIPRGQARALPGVRPARARSRPSLFSHLLWRASGTRPSGLAAAVRLGARFRAGAHTSGVDGRNPDLPVQASLNRGFALKRWPVALHIRVRARLVCRGSVGFSTPCWLDRQPRTLDLHGHPHLLRGIGGRGHRSE